MRLRVSGNDLASFETTYCSDRNWQFTVHLTVAETCATSMEGQLCLLQSSRITFCQQSSTAFLTRGWTRGKFFLSIKGRMWNHAKFHKPTGW